LVLQYSTNFVNGLVDRLVDHLKLILVGASQFSAGDFQPPLDGRFRLGAARPQPPFQFFFRTGSQKNAQHMWKSLTDFFRPVHINI
jgi:hypothetical protein